jgi:hypothetical protein
MELRTRRELTALRLGAQHIAESAPAAPAETVRWMLAMQAQDLPGALWSVGLRSPGSTEASVRAALAAGEIVRSWPMRGTLHLVAPEDLGWMLELTRPRQATWAATRRRDLGITDEELARATQTARDRLAGGVPVRRDVLLSEFEAAGIPTQDQRGYHLLWNLAHDGVTVFGPLDGAHPTFVLFEEWITHHRTLETDEALGEFATRYVRSHGPATDRDFAWWSSLSLTQARRALDIAGVAHIEREGVRYSLAEETTPARATIFALPGFDEFVLGYQDRAAPLTPEHFARIVPGGNGVFRPTIVDAGLVTGTWRRVETAKAVRVEAEPFGVWSGRAATGFARAASRFARFLGKPLATE